jgi:hypothetical protein
MDGVLLEKGVAAPASSVSLEKVRVAHALKTLPHIAAAMI